MSTLPSTSSVTLMEMLYELLEKSYPPSERTPKMLLWSEVTFVKQLSREDYSKQAKDE